MNGISDMSTQAGAAVASSFRGRKRLTLCAMVLMGAVGCGPGPASELSDERAEPVTSASTSSVSTLQLSVDRSSLPVQGPGQGLDEASAVTPQSVSMPCGSWVLSCWNATIGDNYFSATCRTKAGGSRWSSITRAKCPGWALWNDNGVLRCASKC